jgi:hypothetical protein
MECLVGLGEFIVFNATFNNISVIWRRSFSLVEDTGVPTEKHRPTARVFNLLYLHYTPRAARNDIIIYVLLSC